MKKTLFIAVSALLFSVTTMAKDIASYRFATSEVVNEEHTVRVFVATVSDDQILKISLTKASGSAPWDLNVDGEAIEIEEKLTQLAYNQIKTQVVGVSNAPIKREFSPMICMMMAGPAQSNDHLSVARGYDWSTQSFLGELELILGPQGCWVSSKVFPEHKRAEQQAHALKASIKLLTLQFTETL